MPQPRARALAQNGFHATLSGFAEELPGQGTRYVRYRKHLIETAATDARAAEEGAADERPTMLLGWRSARLEHLLQELVAHAADGLALGHREVQ